MLIISLPSTIAVFFWLRRMNALQFSPCGRSISLEIERELAADVPWPHVH